MCNELRFVTVTYLNIIIYIQNNLYEIISHTLCSQLFLKLGQQDHQ